MRVTTKLLELKRQSSITFKYQILQRSHSLWSLYTQQLLSMSICNLNLFCILLVCSRDSVSQIFFNLCSCPRKSPANLKISCPLVP